jgi:hypothetical protein
LLCVLLLRIGAVPADTDQHAVLRAGRSLNHDTTGGAQADAAGVMPSRANRTSPTLVPATVFIMAQNKIRFV